MNAQRPGSFGDWRGRSLDFVTTYQEMGTFRQIASSWAAQAYSGYEGRLALGVPLLPKDKSGTLKQVASGKWDWAFTSLAKSLVGHGRADAIIRLGWEPNGNWYPWSVSPAKAGQYRAAYRHVQGVMKKVGPKFVFSFDLSCGTAMTGQRSRMDALNRLYPGNAAVDIVGCDVYDWHSTKVTSEQSFQTASTPSGSVGLEDVARFARKHRKGLGVPEWGVASTAERGQGDNPVFVEQMQNYFQRNRDLLAYEGYFNDGEGGIKSSLWSPAQNPRSAEAYSNFW